MERGSLWGRGPRSSIIGFFLPWLEGTAEFAARDFSGFDLARLIRNFEITAESQSEAGQIRTTALLVYLMPALVVNSAALWLARRAVWSPCCCGCSRIGCGGRIRLGSAELRSCS